jgi:diguanylate cyclase (GGDEF)-like protein
MAGIIKQTVGSSGTVFRSSGKVFSILLPNVDGRQAEMLAREIRSRIDTYNSSPERKNYKPVTFSCGICVSPYSASTVQELMDNADLAVYNAKKTGKDRIILFKGPPLFSSRFRKRPSILSRIQAISAKHTNPT